MMKVNSVKIVRANDEALLQLAYEMEKEGMDLKTIVPYSWENYLRTSIVVREYLCIFGYHD
jgi:hypothetical protein